MLKFKSIELGSDYRHGYDPGCKTGLGCKVTFQHGEQSYETMELKLSSEAVERVVKLAVAEAVAMLEVDLTTIDVEGAPGKPEPKTDDAGKSPPRFANLVAVAEESAPI